MGGAGGAAPAYEPCPEPPEPCRILPFGDSITDGFNVPGGYRMQLFRASLENGQNITFVGSSSNGPNDVDGTPFPRDHEGHSGFTIDDAPAAGREGIRQFVVSSMSAYEPHVVVLKIGTNDLNTNFEVATAPQRLAELVDFIFEQNSDVLLVLTQIVPSRNDGLNQRVEDYNGAFDAIVDDNVAQGRHMLLVDMYGTFTSNPNYKSELLADDLHPSTVGYDLMGQVFYDTLSEFLR